ncbi:nuclear envelope pore membrane protein POM 121-like isoform X2 [Balaenoptera musculus]|uniref:Nuclear envelope pore membrane protein POM 121-like isoform X2 n=1 Tax=Balaenoptera musculus TaxID=9771 RepID=A0A8B8Y8P2_BALMU|nr:nuclear envelope pore membrane protein POM 121-like isoform X2 [Balaenoptera musculus]
MGNLRCKCRTWCRRCQPRRGAPVGCHPLVLPSWEAATSDRNHPAAPTPAFCPSRRLSHRDRVPLLPGFHIALKTQYPIQQARYSRLGMLPLVSWRDSPKKPVLSAHNSIMVGHLRAIKSPPLGHKFTLLHSPAEQVVKVRKPIPSSHLPLPSPKEREVKVPSHAMVFSAPTACCSLLLERPTKEVLGEDHQPISPGSLMSGKELQREKSSHIPSRSSSSLLSTSSRPCKQKIPLPLFLPLPGLRSPPLGIEALTWDRDPHLRLQPSSVLQQAAPLTPNLWTPHLLPRLSFSSLPLSPGRANSHFTGLFLVLGTHQPVVAMPQPMPRLIYLQHQPTDRPTLQACLDPGLPSQATLGANDGQRPNDYFLLGNPAASVQDKVLVAPEA